MVKFLSFMIVTTVFIVAVIINGWALSVLWGWFVSPLFHLPPLSIPYAIGICLIVNHLTKQTPKENNDKKDTNERIADIIAILINPLISVLFGWIVYLLAK